MGYLLDVCAKIRRGEAVALLLSAPSASGKLPDWPDLPLLPERVLPGQMKQ
jgi:hypothetical protein